MNGAEMHHVRFNKVIAILKEAPFPITVTFERSLALHESEALLRAKERWQEKMSVLKEQARLQRYLKDMIGIDG